jgi:hypothetical protein
MGAFIYGTHTVATGVEEFLIKCPSCEAHSPADVMVFSRYYHIYWVPIAPIGKEANVFCHKCGSKRIGLPFDSWLVSNYDEIKSGFKHPFFTYIGVGIISLVILAFIISALTPR